MSSVQQLSKVSENNKLISQFMGTKEPLNYEDSLEKLRPVVEKIFNYGYRVTIGDSSFSYTTISDTPRLDICESGGTILENAYKAIITFIKHFNKECPKTFVCEKCDSEDVSQGATVNWNRKEQRWEVICIKDEPFAHCHDCDDETNINERVIKD